MAGIILAFPKMEDAKGIKNLLARNGFAAAAVCTTGAQAISHADHLGGGIVICSYKMPDMLYSELHECLPKGFEMLLMASRHILAECMDNGIVCLAMPVKVGDLVNTVDMMLRAQQKYRKQRREKQGERNEEESALISKAKKILMDRNNMTEGEAHRYIQKCSMDSSTSMVEMAQMVLTMMK